MRNNKILFFKRYFDNYSKDKYVYQKFLFIGLTIISLAISIPNGINYINNLIKDNAKKTYEIKIENNQTNNSGEYNSIISNNNETDDNQINTNINYENESTNNVELNNNSILHNIEREIKNILTIANETKNDVQKINNSLKGDNTNSIILAIISGIFSIIVPIISLLGQIIISKRISSPEIIIIESANDNIYMQLKKVSYKEKFINREEVLLINGGRYEIIKFSQKEKKYIVQNRKVNKEKQKYGINI